MIPDEEPDFTLCVGDGLPLLKETLQNGDGTTPDLTGATVVLVIQDSLHANDPFGGAATIVGDPITGTVQYTWQETDTQAAGEYFYRWVVTFLGNPLPATYPNRIRPRTLVLSNRT